MYEQLLRVVPAARADALRHEVALLESTLEAAWPDPADRAVAGASDSQGFGGHAKA